VSLVQSPAFDWRAIPAISGKSLSSITGQPALLNSPDLLLDGILLDLTGNGTSIEISPAFHQVEDFL
jgi:hypothetical protein